jgi:hypothetical protein
LLAKVISQGSNDGPGYLASFNRLDGLAIDSNNNSMLLIQAITKSERHLSELIFLN